MQRYHSLSYILSLDIEEALSQISYAYKQREEELLFQRWVQGGVHLTTTFEDFKTTLKPKKIKKEAEILSEVEDILENYEGGWLK